MFGSIHHDCCGCWFRWNNTVNELRGTDKKNGRKTEFWVNFRVFYSDLFGCWAMLLTIHSLCYFFFVTSPGRFKMFIHNSRCVAHQICISTEQFSHVTVGIYRKYPLPQGREVNVDRTPAPCWLWALQLMQMRCSGMCFFYKHTPV